MADTVRTPATLLTTLFQDGQAAGSISPQDMRDLIVSIRAPHGRMASNVPAETTITTQGVYVKVAGTTTLGAMPLLVDMPADNRLRYTGTVDRHFHIVLQGSVEFASGTNQIASLQLYHYDASAATGALVPHTIAPSVVAGANITQVVSHSDLHLDTNDYIELHVANLSGTANITVENLYVFMMGMF